MDITWLTATTVYVLLVLAPGGLDSQLGVYTSKEACEAARDLLAEQVSPRGAYEVQQPLRAGQEDLGLRSECRQRVRATYGK